MIINKVPLYDGPDFVTTQNLGHGNFAPHYVFNRGCLVEGITRAGYRLVDEWAVLERDLYLPGRPDKRIRAFSGLCFKRV